MKISAVTATCPRVSPRLATWRRMYIAGIGLLAAVTLAGCGEKTPDGESREVVNARADKALATALKSIDGSGDPMIAFNAVKKAKRVACPEDGICNYLPSWEQATKDAVAYLNRAIANDDPKAFETLYLPGPKSQPDELDTARLDEENAKRFLAYAEQLHAANKTEGALLRRAAGIVMDGNLVVRDTGRAVNLLARSWAAGYAQSASTAAWVFASISDYRNAYLWSLRCTAGCERDDSVKLDDLQKRLNAEAVRQAQKAAQDPSVIELDTTGA